MFEKNSKGVDKKEEDDFRPRNSKVSLAISKCFFPASILLLSIKWISIYRSFFTDLCGTQPETLSNCFISCCTILVLDTCLVVIQPIDCREHITFLLFYFCLINLELFGKRISLIQNNESQVEKFYFNEVSCLGCYFIIFWFFHIPYFQQMLTGTFGSLVIILKHSQESGS